MFKGFLFYYFKGKVDGIIRVNNKLESLQFIKRLNLNTFPEQLFYENQEKEVATFLEKYPAKYYAVRSKEVVGCRENDFKILRNNVLEEIRKKGFRKFTINVSSYNYTSHLVFIGDFMIGRDNRVWLIGSRNSNFTGRIAEQYPDFNLNTDIFDKKLNLIPGFDEIYQYLVLHNLFNVIVELALYDEPVGIFLENVVIFEIRSEF